MRTLVDTNVLVYRYDARFPEKQRIAMNLLRDGVAAGSIFVAHQALLEFMAAVTRVRVGEPPLLVPADARREVEEMLEIYEILYPSAGTVRLALRGQATYGLSWFAAHMWAYAEGAGLGELLSEDFEHGRLYGTVRARNPFTATL